MRLGTGVTVGVWSCLALSTLGQTDGSGAGGDAGERNALAMSMANARESESGFEWDARFRDWLTRRLGALPLETLRQIAPGGATADLRPLLEAAAQPAGDVVVATIGDSDKDLVFTPVLPCRAAATINPPISAPINVPAGGFTAVNYRTRGTTGFEAQGGNPGGCGIPASAIAIAVNYTVASPAAPGHIEVDPTHLGNSGTSILNFSPAPAGYNLANGVVSPLCDLLASTCSSGDIRVTVRFGSTHLIIDITGYFAPPPLTGPLAPTVTAVTASAPLASSGGLTPNVSLSGIVPAISGGTGLASLTANGVLFGQGTAAVGNAVGVAGQVLTGTAGVPAWTGSPSLSGDITLVSPSTTSAGNILKGANRFIHNFGTQNTFIGENAGNFTTSGTGFNTAIGADALTSNTTGVSNTASGAQALSTNGTGSNNTAIGRQALVSNSNTSNNTAIGVSSLAATTGSSNIGIGHNGGASLTTGNNNIDIGNVGVAAESATIRIGTLGTHTRAFIAGIRGVTTANANAIAVLVDSAGQLGTVNSSRRFKDDIADMDVASAGLMKLRPVTFHYKADQSPAGRTLQYGLIAEEVAGVYPGLVARSADGQIETVLYQFLPPMLLNELQRQQRTIQAQAGEVQRQATELKQQTARVAELQQDRQAQTARIAELEQDRKVQLARIDALEKQALEFAALKQQSAKTAAALERLTPVAVAGR